MANEQLLLQKFEILRPGFGSNVSGVLPATPYAIGKALMISAVDADTNDRTFALAAGHCDGLMLRPSRTQVGNTDTEQLYGFTAADGGGETSTPFTVSTVGTIGPLPEEMIVEGPDYLFLTPAGTGVILAGTAAETELAFALAGQLRIAQTGDMVQYKIRKQLTVTDTTVTATDQVRLQIYKVQGYKK
jgi:hypothetical protein